MEFCLLKGIGYNFRFIVIAVYLTMAISSNTVMPTTFKEISDNYGWPHPQFERTGAVFRYYWFGYNQK